MVLFRRYLTVAALAVWQGGFIFYTAVVVPIGTDFLGSATEQGFITRRVTESMNACGAFALALMAWDLVAGRDPWKLRTVARVVLFVVMAAVAAGLYHMHGRLESLLDVSNHDVLDRHVFRPLHRVYLWLSSGQWGCAATYLALTLSAWRGEDSKVCGSVEK